MVQAQLIALLYWLGGEFMYLVFTTSTGEAITVVAKPAPNAETKWQGRLSGDIKKTQDKSMNDGDQRGLCSQFNCIETHMSAACATPWTRQYK